MVRIPDVFDVSTDDITEGPLLRTLLLLAGPLLAQNAVRVVEQLADVFFLGRATETAVAGASLGAPLVQLLFALAVFTPLVGTQVVVSQYAGAADEAGGARALAAGVAIALVLSLTVGALGYLGARPLVDLLTAVRPGGTDGSVQGLAAAYVRVYALGLPLLALSDTIEGAFLGRGDSRGPLAMNVLAVLASVALDPVFIFGLEAGPLRVPALGIRGAALSAVVGAGLSLLLGVGLLTTRHEGLLSSRGLTPSGLASPIRGIVDVGAPNAAQQLARQTARVAVVVVVFAAGGAAALAAYFVGARVAAVAYIPALGLQQAAQSIVGQNLGAGLPARAHRTTLLGAGVAAGGLAVVGLVQWLFAGPIVAGLVPTADGATVALSVAYLGILAVGYPAIGAAYLFEAGFNGARRTRTSFVATLCQFWAVRLPLAAGVALGLGVGAVGVFWAVTVSNVVVAVGLAAYYHREATTGMLARATAAAAD